MESNKWFGQFARGTSRAAGRPMAFMLALGVVLVWAVTGPLFGFSDTWQLVINTGTTVVTFLMVFLIQSTQNRDAEAVQLKLDELIRVTEGAHNTLLDLEDIEEEQLDRIRASYARLAEHARRLRRAGGDDTHPPDVADDPVQPPEGADVPVAPGSKRG
jgi:low affinity Fe/Cu permease